MKTVLTALNNAEINDFYAELDSIGIAQENVYQEIGRKYLRGKLN